MKDLIISYLAPLILSFTPISLILIKYLSRLFSKHDPLLGQTTVLCTNITGTLTEENLIVRTFYFDKYKGKIEDNSRFIKIEDREERPGEEALIEKNSLIENETFRLMSVIAFLCKFKKTRSTEEIIKTLMMECGFSKGKTETDYEMLQELHSNLEKKFSTVITFKKETKEIFAFTKGNPLKILKKCTKATINGKKVDIDYQMARKFRKRIKQLNKNGQKVIGFAYKQLPFKKQEKYTEHFAENDMTFLGIMGITNLLKTNLKEPMDAIKTSGIKTYILTSQKEKKALAIAKIHKLVNPLYCETITGEYLSRLNDQKISKMLLNKEKDYIFAELKEEDKLKIIALLRQQGETVAVINKKGKNNLKEMIDAINKGKIIQSNYKKFSKHAISCKIAETLLILTAFALKAMTPLSIILIISLDLFVNIGLEFSLRVSDINKEQLNIKKSLANLLINGISMGIIVSAIYILSLIRYGWNIGETLSYTDSAFLSASSITFMLLAALQIANAFNLKNENKSILKTNIFSNLYLILTTIISILLIYILTTFSIFNNYFKLEKISTLEWEIVLFCVLILIIIEEFRKFFTRKT